MAFKKYDAAIGEMGLSMATRKLVEKFGERIEIEYEQGAEESLSQESVFVVGTHVGRLDASAIVAAMPERDDSFVIGNVILEGIGPNFSKHLIPIELVNGARNIVKDLARKAAGFPPINTDTTRSKRKNQESLNRAAQIINDGGRVLIFPDNVHKRGRDDWLKGIGHILKQLNPHAKIIFADADPNIKPLQALKGGNIVFTSVSFSRPITVKELLGADIPTGVDSVVETIEERYKKWQEELK